ncbi:Aste57867_20398 [Aphanomyces stellatus]|uniref:Aste57867_20398 protein n=1 Tax=Aphanomyces stellatus TaxID=120398 RepID=A0A485LFK9_9STRA|nr:hypothetical protein As57867_020332 [Aphanomyces stellatus]VFT97084.1 Aste57867_20398 [Aphanomyces stellatus]
MLEGWLSRPYALAAGIGLLGASVIYLTSYDPSLDSSRIAIPLNDDERSVAQLSEHSLGHDVVSKSSPKRKAQLFAQTWIPQSGSADAKAVVILVHGLNEHSSNMLSLVQSLLEEGYIVYAFDHEGFGRSSGLHAHVYCFESLVDDIHQHIQTVHAKWPSKKRFVLGGSLGGALILHRLLKDASDVDGAIIQCPALEIHASRKPPAAIQAIGFAIKQVAPHLALLSSNGGKGSSESVREQMQKIKLADPLYYTGKLRVGTAFEVSQCVEMLQQKLQLKRSLPLAILLQHGTADVICSIEGSQEWFDRIEDCPDKTFKSYEDTAHDLLHEPAANQVVEDVIKWLNQRC